MSRGDIVVASQNEISVYVSAPGYICIRQLDCDGDEQIITIIPLHAQSVAKAILGKINEAQESRQLWIEEEE